MKSIRTLFAAVLLTCLFASFSFADTTHGTLSTLGSTGALNPNIVVTGYSQSVNVYNYKSAVLSTSVAVTTPAAKTFTCVAATDICTATAGFVTGMKGQASTTTTLPAGLSTSTDYFPIMITPTTFKLASSYANAIAGTAIDITDTGTGTHTFTPTALAGGAVSVQGSIDGTTFFDITSSSQNITTAAVFYWNVSDTFYPVVRLKFVNTAGVLTAATQYAAKF